MLAWVSELLNNLRVLRCRNKKSICLRSSSVMSVSEFFGNIFNSQTIRSGHAFDQYLELSNIIRQNESSVELKERVQYLNHWTKSLRKTSKCIFVARHNQFAVKCYAQFVQLLGKRETSKLQRKQHFHENTVVTNYLWVEMSPSFKMYGRAGEC